MSDDFRNRFRDQASEPVRKIIEENPGITTRGIMEKMGPFEGDLTSRQRMNNLHGNQLYHLQRTGRIESRKGNRGLRWYLTHDEFLNVMCEPVRKIIEETPGLTLPQIAERIDRSTWSTIQLTDREFLNGLRENQMKRLQSTEKIENRGSGAGSNARWYIKEQV